MKDNEIIKTVIEYCVKNVNRLKGLVGKDTDYIVGGRRLRENQYSGYIFMHGEVIQIVIHLIETQAFFNQDFGNPMDGCAEIIHLKEGKEYEITAKYFAGKLSPMTIPIKSQTLADKINTKEKFAIYADALGIENTKKISEELFEKSDSLESNLKRATLPELDKGESLTIKGKGNNSIIICGKGKSGFDVMG